MIPDPNWNYPECWAEYSLEAKKKKADEIFARLLPHYDDILSWCHGDFKIASLVAYKIAVKYYKDNVPITPCPDEFRDVEKSLLPVCYCGGNMCFGRLFAINHCAFSSSDSIIGFRNSEYEASQSCFKVLKGLKFIGTHHNWALFNLDKTTTDDMTGMLYSPLEKNFTIEFAHFPHDAQGRFVFRWEDC